MSYKNIVIEDQRLVILRTLKDMNGEANDSILHKVLKQFGHEISRDQVKTQLHWLNEQDLISIESVLNTDVAKLTGRGFDVAEGDVKVPGVGAPRPGA